MLGGVQFVFNAEEGTTFEPLEALNEFERVGQWQSETQYLFMAYSMSKKTLGVGKHALLRISGEAELAEISLSDPRGAEVAAIRKTPTAVSTIETMQMQKAYPNPFTGELFVLYIIGENGHKEATLVVTDIAGRTVAIQSVSAAYGAHTAHITATGLSSGIYFVNLYIDGSLIQTDKVVKQ